ncbi:MAG TPA: aminopeptidase P family N-terminal domain-containing protein, partial [Pirellulales bacterium]|nr:aminopeptidase P family N-terminal domain-containing protein [Pirellulales bacterium]
MPPTAAEPDNDLSACRRRQKRLLAVMERLDLDLIVVTQIEHVQYLAGPRFKWVFAPSAALDRQGQLTLVAPASAVQEAAADRVVTYEAQWHSTLRNDQRQASSAALLAALAGHKPARIGCEFSSISRHITDTLEAKWIDIEPELYQLRRRKD